MPNTTSDGSELRGGGGLEHLTSHYDSWRGPHCWNLAVTAQHPVPKLQSPSLRQARMSSCLQMLQPHPTPKDHCRNLPTDHGWTLPGLRVCLFRVIHLVPGTQFLSHPQCGYKQALVSRRVAESCQVYRAKISGCKLSAAMLAAAKSQWCRYSMHTWSLWHLKC